MLERCDLHGLRMTLAKFKPGRETAATQSKGMSSWLSVWQTVKINQDKATRVESCEGENKYILIFIASR